jgi:hypothetical protein
MLALIIIGIACLGLSGIVDIIGIVEGNPDDRVVLSINLVPIVFAIVVLSLNIHC